MAGGMGTGRGGRTLADRSALAAGAHRTVNVPPHVTPGPGPAYGETSRYLDPRGGPQHVWVTTDAGRQAGLLVEWRKPDQLPWEGRVVHHRLEGVRWLTVEEWLPGSCVEPL